MRQNVRIRSVRSHICPVFTCGGKLVVEGDMLFTLTRLGCCPRIALAGDIAVIIKALEASEGKIDLVSLKLMCEIRSRQACGSPRANEK